MFGHVAVEDPSPVMRNDEEAVQHAESQRRYGEEIHCRDGCSRMPPIALLAQDSAALSSSTATLFARKYQSQASSARRECAVLCLAKIAICFPSMYINCVSKLVCLRVKLPHAAPAKTSVDHGNVRTVVRRDQWE